MRRLIGALQDDGVDGLVIDWEELTARFRQRVVNRTPQPAAATVQAAGASMHCGTRACATSRQTTIFSI
mgnify:CR=1 FL=1